MDTVNQISEYTHCFRWLGFRMRLYARYLALLTFITAGVCLVVIHMQGPTLPPMPARDRSPMVPERTRSGKTPFEVTAQTLATASHVTKYKFEHFVRTYTPSAGPARSHHITNLTVITAGRSAEGRKKSTFTTPVSTNVKKVNKPTTRPLMLPHAPYVKVNESDGKVCMV
ncbi:hypothetical protein BaRGS_00010856 [Batillaria attramentaria]|uniref:Uncharacterized protein n=1 Tax=Batillaria attramentaria TaxID=370345 RepID=A0ABD0LF30_9CAEN